MKRVMACLVLAVAVAACGSRGSDGEFAPTRTTWQIIPTTCEVTGANPNGIVFEVLFTNTLASRSDFLAKVDVYDASGYLGATEVSAVRVPPGVTAKVGGFHFTVAHWPWQAGMQCLAYDIRTGASS